MPFVKLDCAMLDSTVYLDRDVRDVFITALLMATPRDVETPLQGLNVTDLEPSGFAVPPGFYGMVEASGPGIVRRAGLDQPIGMKALEALCAPETESRSRDHEGRRMARVDGGYIVLNYGKYRERDYTGAERQKRWRDRQREDATGSDVTPSRHDVTPLQGRHVTHADADADAEDRVRGEKMQPTAAPPLSLNGSPETKREKTKGTRIPEDWKPEMGGLEVPDDFNLRGEADKFRDYWKARAGAGGIKLDWLATWRNWVRRAVTDGGYARNARSSAASGGPRLLV